MSIAKIHLLSGKSSEIVAAANAVAKCLPDGFRLVIREIPTNQNQFAAAVQHGCNAVEFPASKLPENVSREGFIFTISKNQAAAKAK